MNDTSPTKLREFVHNARNDLNVITMGIQSLEDFKDEPERIEELIEIIFKSGILPLREKLDFISREIRSKEKSDL